MHTNLINQDFPARISCSSLDSISQTSFSDWWILSSSYFLVSMWKVLHQNVLISILLFCVHALEQSISMCHIPCVTDILFDTCPVWHISCLTHALFDPVWHILCLRSYSGMHEPKEEESECVADKHLASLTAETMFPPRNAMLEQLHYTWAIRWRSLEAFCKSVLFSHFNGQ